MTLDKQEAFYESIQDELESESLGKWAVVADETLIGVYDRPTDAAYVAYPYTQTGTCVVKRIGLGTKIPATVATPFAFSEVSIS